jgi:hypothetical protein
MIANASKQTDNQRSPARFGNHLGSWLPEMAMLGNLSEEGD